MSKNLIDELKWRGLFQDMIPETEAHLQSGRRVGYIGFDPTSSSFTIGNMVQIILLRHLQLAGHKPLAIMGGATGLIGDPSGKDKERQLMTIEQVEGNIAALRKEFSTFLDFDGENKAEILNNYDWMKDFSFIDFIRSAGKHLSINYMLAKESVKSRIETGMSFTEFSYQLVQGYDFYHLYKHHNCSLQMGGSDQWGNITTGTEFIRRIDGGKAFALTTPLVTKADGSKFGKSEGNNVWLSSEKTSPYQFYQFWLNASDDDAQDWVKKFCFFSKSETEGLINEHLENPSLRQLQKIIAKDLCVRLHGEEAYNGVVLATKILFGKSSKEDLLSLTESQLLDTFKEVPSFEMRIQDLEDGMDVVDFLSEATGILKSKGEARRALKENSISINKEKVVEAQRLSKDDLLQERYILAQRGKKNYFLVKLR